MLLQQIIIFLFSIIFFQSAFAQGEQPVRPLLRGTTDCESDSIFYLYSFRGGHMQLSDSALVKNGEFYFKSGRNEIGYFRLKSEDFATDLILSPSETPRIAIHSCNDSFTVSGSLENRLLEELKSYSIGSGKEKFSHIADSIFKIHPETFFSRSTSAYLKSRSGEYTGPEFLAIIPFHDPELIRSTIFPGLFMQYFRDYVQYDEPGFKYAIDTLITLSSVHPEMREYTIEFLMDLFHAAGPEVIFEYMIDNYYLGPGCASTKSDDHALKYLSLRPGSVAPDTLVTFMDGTQITLKDFYNAHEVSVIYFWASDCPHCIEEHPGVKKLYEIFKEKMGIIGVSLDEKVESCLHTVKEFSMNWPVICETNGWDSGLTRKFLVNKTPTIILVDQSGKLISRNVLPAELPARLQSLLGD